MFRVEGQPYTDSPDRLRADEADRPYGWTKNPLLHLGDHPARELLQEFIPALLQTSVWSEVA